jgi:hypothetical protein
LPDRRITPSKVFQKGCRVKLNRGQRNEDQGESLMENGVRQKVRKLHEPIEHL